MMIAPASRTRAAGGASADAGVSTVDAAPKGIEVPLVAIFSLIVIGTPSRAPIGSFFIHRFELASAWAIAPSRSWPHNALTAGSRNSILEITASITSRGVKSPLR
ncbi:unannotated protein [freshwater metagenome]|uniref:Unannotated protein n=1 Tax=freshwater metagenome TaxID=449393 RepID=A0A6J6KS93_9ZZZZ